MNRFGRLWPFRGVTVLCVQSCMHRCACAYALASAPLLQHVCCVLPLPLLLFWLRGDHEKVRRVNARFRKSPWAGDEWKRPTCITPTHIRPPPGCPHTQTHATVFLGARESKGLHIRASMSDLIKWSLNGRSPPPWAFYIHIATEFRNIYSKILRERIIFISWRSIELPCYCNIQAQTVFAGKEVLCLERSWISPRCIGACYDGSSKCSVPPWRGPWSSGEAWLLDTLCRLQRGFKLANRLTFLQPQGSENMQAYFLSWYG